MSRANQDITVTAATSLTNQQGVNGRLIIGDTTAAPFTVTLPPNPADGQEVKIARIGANVLTIAPAASPVGTTVNGAGSLALGAARDIAYLRYDQGLNDWFFLGGVLT